MQYKLLIFDWDGTLADSAAMISSAMQKAATAVGLPARTDQAIRELIGLGFNEALQRLYPELKVEDVRHLLDGYRAQWLSDRVGEAPLFRGALETLRELHTAGYRLAIATGKSRRGLDRSLRHHAELAPLILCSRCADESANKPDPLMLRQLLDEQELDAGAALMIGDTEYDMQMARALDMPAVGVSCGVHEVERLRSAGAVDLIGFVSELPAWLEAKARLAAAKGDRSPLAVAGG